MKILILILLISIYYTYDESLFCQDVFTKFPNGGNKIEFNQSFTIKLNEVNDKTYSFLYNIIDLENGNIYILGSSNDNSYVVPSKFIKPSKKLRLLIIASNADTSMSIFSDNLFYINNTNELNPSYQKFDKSGNFSIFPNPFENFLQISFGEKYSLSSISIIDILGNTLLHYNFNGMILNDFTLNTDFIKYGFYQLIIENIKGQRYSYGIYKQ